jgi:hypothetical protein
MYGRSTPTWIKDQSSEEMKRQWKGWLQSSE